MTKEHLVSLATDFADHSPANRVPEEKALRPGLAGMRMFAAPLLGFGAAADGYLLGLAANPAANLPLEPPGFWLAGAKTVISFFSALYRAGAGQQPQRPELALRRMDAGAHRRAALY